MQDDLENLLENISDDVIRCGDECNDVFTDLENTKNGLNDLLYDLNALL